MLTNVDVSGIRPGLATLSLPLAGSQDSAIQIKNIEGLDPVEAAVTSSNYGAFDGEALTGMSVGKRNIVFTFGLNPDWATQTMEELRQELYKYFMPKLDTRLDFTSTHLPDCYILGIVESMKPNMFSADPEIQVSILCSRPDFIASDETVETGVVDDALIYGDLEYIGSTPTGINLKVESSVALATYTEWLTVATNWITPELFELKDNVAVDATHFFELNSIPGEKYVRTILIADPTDYNNILNEIIGPNPIWPILRPGTNGFCVQALTAGQTWELSYFARFGGL